MHEEALINFMREVSTKLGSVESSLAEINRRLNEGNGRMEKYDQLHDTLTREILVLKNEDTEIKKVLADESKKRGALEQQLAPIANAWNTVGTNRRFIIFVSTTIVATMATAAAFWNAIDLMRGK